MITLGDLSAEGAILGTAWQGVRGRWWKEVTLAWSELQKEVIKCKPKDRLLQLNSSLPLPSAPHQSEAVSYIFSDLWSSLPGGSDSKETACNAEDPGSFPGLGRPWRRKWQATPVLPGETHGQRHLAGYSPWVAVRHDCMTTT